jgi:hypothetical protein
MRILLLTIIMIFASSASAGLYKWVDDEGNVHYSQKRPTNQQFKKLKAPPPAPENSKPLYQPLKQKTKADELIGVETAKIKKIRETHCATAKKNVKNYKVFRRFRDKDGKLTVLNDEQSAQKVEEAKKMVNEFCQ